MGVIFMKSKHLLLCLLFSSCLLAGCGGKSADEYVGETITSLKEGDASSFSNLMTAGIEESNTDFVLQFPEELEASYEKLLQAGFQSIEFEVEAADKQSDDTYIVKISYTPIDFMQSLRDTNDEILKDTQSADFKEEMTYILEQDNSVITDSPAYASKTFYELTVQKDGDDYSITDAELTDFLKSTILNYMDPYNTGCELFDMQDFLRSYLDASFKGEVTQFALHTDRTEEEALEWYEADVFDPPEELDPVYEDRYRKALQTIMKNCDYTVGIPRKEDELFHYQIDVSFIPNNSFIDAFQEFESGTYYSVAEVSEGLITTLEKYAANPTYGEETQMTVAINSDSVANADQEGSDIYELVTSIYPLPQ